MGSALRPVLLLIWWIPLALSLSLISPLLPRRPWIECRSVSRSQAHPVAGWRCKSCLIDSSPISSFPVGSFPSRQRQHSPGSLNPLRKFSSSTSLSLALSSFLPSLPLIAADDTWGNWSFLLSMAALAQTVGKTTVVGRLLGSPVTAMALVFFAASCGILTPGGTTAATSLQLLALNLATPLVLLGADWQSHVLRRCGPLTISFAAATLATVVGSMVGWQLVRPRLLSAFSSNNDGLIIAAALVAKNIGGGINYVAVCRTLQASPTAMAAGLCIDNIMALVYFPITNMLAANRPDIATEEMVEATSIRAKDEEFSVQSITTTLALAASLLWMGKTLGQLVLGGTAAMLPVCTLLSVVLATWGPSRLLQSVQQPASTLGSMALFIFFATAGAPGLAVADSVQVAIWPLSLFLLSLYSIHGAILACCQWLGSSGWALPQRLLVASSAAIGGPATAVALAQSAGWKSLEVPSILVGNIGYAIATFIGLGFYQVFRP
jgi:uncharacterized membrane protein